jgi:hypothetical protein
VSVGGPNLDTSTLYAPNIIETYTRAAAPVASTFLKRVGY